MEEAGRWYITMPPMQHQITLSSPLYSRSSLWDPNNHFTYKIHQVSKTYSQYNSRPFGTSGLKPFIGHITKAGTVSPTILFVEKDVVLSEVKNMVSLISWTNRSRHLQDGAILESNISVLIEYILKFYTDTPLSDLYPFIPQRKSGTIQHHLRSASFRESIVPNILSNIINKSSVSQIHALPMQTQPLTILLTSYIYIVT